MLLIAILLGSLAAGRRSDYKRPLGLACSARSSRRRSTWLLATLVIDLAPVNRELLEAITALIAVVVLIVVSFWLIQRLEHRRRMEFMRARTAAAIAAGIVGARSSALGFTAVYREGFETVLFYQALVAVRRGPRPLGRLGAVAAAVALAGGRLRDPAPRREAAAQADADHRRDDPAAAQRRLRRQRRALAAGGRPDRRRPRSTAAGRGCRCSSPS